MADYLPWNKTPASDSRMNRVTVIPNTGAHLATYDKSMHGLFICTATGGGLIVNHLYMCSADATTLIDISGISPHMHADDSTGGPIIDLFRDGNPSFVNLWLTKTQDLKNAQWITAITGTAAITDDIDGTTGERSIKLATGATTSSGATISYPHLKLDFTKESFFQTKLRISTASSLALHTGVNCDDVTAADSNTRKYNAEACTATNSNWFLRSADGGANSTSDSGIAMTANRVAIMIKHFPTAPLLQMHVDQAAAFEKTTNIPTTGETADNNVIKHSVKNNTGADRPLFMYGSRLAYVTSASWFHG